VARWAAGAKWAEGPAPDDQRDTPLVLSLSEGLGITALSQTFTWLLEKWPEECSLIAQEALSLLRVFEGNMAFVVFQGFNSVLFVLCKRGERE
jgi:hypothetical protein